MYRAQEFSVIVFQLPNHMKILYILVLTRTFLPSFFLHFDLFMLGAYFLGNSKLQLRVIIQQCEKYKLMHQIREYLGVVAHPTLQYVFKIIWIQTIV
jgi:hypothetical protein